MSIQYDVVVIGAGPIGSYTAYQLVERGFDVCLLDQKETIGKDIICTGIISKNAFQRYDLPTESILSRIDSFVFISPEEKYLEYIHPDVFAYVVSREIFDVALLKQAKKCGVDIHLNECANRIEESTKYYTVRCKRRTYRTRAVVLATGVNYGLHASLGLSKPAGFLHGAQIEISPPKSIQPSRIEIYIGRRFAPGSFGWVVPTGQNLSRIGVIVEQKARLGLERLLKERLNYSVSQINKQKFNQKTIAFGPIKRSVKNKILAVGEAAGQVKTTTGGGIFYGLLCSEIAVDKMYKALKKDQNLNDYEVTWRSALVSELDIGMRLRKIARSLDDTTIENLFKFVKQHRFWVELLLPRINFDYHSNFLFYCLKSFESLLVKHKSNK